MSIPLQINHTNPVSVELVRFELGMSTNESITLSVKEVKKMQKEAERSQNGHGQSPVLLQYPVKKSGLYKMLRVVDDTNFEVSRRTSEALVVSCPSAQVEAKRPNRCRGELSDLSLLVSGTPPLKVKYSRSRKEDDRSVTYENIQPEEFSSPLVRQDSSALVLASSNDLSWAAPHQVRVPLNETLDEGGRWTYSIEEVTDALNNVVSYLVVEDGEKPRSKSPHSEGSFLVHELPKVLLEALRVKEPLRVAHGKSEVLPIKFGSTGKGAIMDAEHKLEYLFTPLDALTATGEHGANAQLHKFSASKIGKQPTVREAGLYTLHSVATKFCAGEVEEPASVMLINPPQPDIVIEAHEIADKCAGRPVGLRLDFDMVGTPPFIVHYEIQTSSQTEFRTKQFGTSRGSIELKPENAGSYTYRVTELKDKVYESVPLESRHFVFEQKVRPSVSAHFLQTDPQKRVVRTCIDQPAIFEVFLQGEGPWTLDYELIYQGRRMKKQITGIEKDVFSLRTDSLDRGGDYKLALMAVKDKSGCIQPLHEEATIIVPTQKPKAHFGNIEGKKSIRTLAGKDIQLPVRLSGDGPWKLEYQDANGKTHVQNMVRANSIIEVSTPGVYRITGVSDVCPGVVDDGANTFEIIQIARPTWAIAESPLLEKRGDTHVRKDVCEGEEDAVDIIFEGRPPFSLKSEEHIELEQGRQAVKNRDISVPLHTTQVKLDTVKVGNHTYRFSALGDENYDADRKHPQSLTIRQQVNARPSATFVTPGKVYSFCQGEEGGTTEEVIPIKLHGHPPFIVDVEIRAIGKITRATPITFRNIDSTSYNIRIPHDHLQPGNSALIIRRIRDSRGCERLLDATPSTPRVQISVHDPPSIAPVESRTHYCVGDRVSFTLSGLAPFSVFYNFEGAALKATVQTPVFRRLADHPGNFTITGISDDASKCRGSASITNVIHGMPSVKVSNGHNSQDRTDIHAGGEADIVFEFGGVPPFEFTFIRSENVKKGDRRDHGTVLETRTLTSQEKKLRIKASEEGTYEVVAIRDKFCSYAKPGSEGLRAAGSRLLREKGEE